MLCSSCQLRPQLGCSAAFLLIQNSQLSFTTEAWTSGMPFAAQSWRCEAGGVLKLWLQSLERAHTCWRACTLTQTSRGLKSVSSFVAHCPDEKLVKLRLCGCGDSRTPRHCPCASVHVQFASTGEGRMSVRNGMAAQGGVGPRGSPHGELSISRLRRACGRGAYRA